MKRKKLIPEKEEEREIKAPQKDVLASEIITEKSKLLSEEKTEEIRDGIRFIIEPSRRKSVKKAKVFIEGKLGINNTLYIAKRIRDILTSYNIVDFKLRNIENFDLSSIQILYYFKALFNNEQQTISFQIEGLPTALKTILVKTKYNKILFKKPINKA